MKTDLGTKVEIAQRLARGESKTVIARATGMDQGNIYKFEATHKEFIAKETEKLMSALPQITDQTIRDIRTADHISKVMAKEESALELAAPLQEAPAMIAFMKEAYRKQSDVLKAIGIYPTNTTNNYIQQNFFQQNTVMISPQVMGVLGKYMQDIYEAEDIDES